MEYKIENGPAFTTLTVKLKPGENFKSEGGAMVAMSPSIDLKSKKQGKGVFGMVKAAFGGEGLFSSQYTANGDAGEVIIAPPTPGDILAHELKGGTFYAQNGAYLAGSSDLELSTKGSWKSMVSGEGLFLQKISGQGTVFCNAYGVVIEKELKTGEAYMVDTGHIVAFEETVSYRIQKAAKGILSSIISGEGLVCRFEGPGKIYIQNRNLSGFAKLLQKLAKPAKG